MVEGMRADCLIVDSRPQNHPVTTTWARSRPSWDPPGQPAWPAQAALTASQQPTAPQDSKKHSKSH